LRKVSSFAVRRPTSRHCRASGLWPSASISVLNKEAFRTATLESQLGGDLLPALAFGTDQRIRIELNVVEEHLVEMLATGQVSDGTDDDPRQAEVDDELRHTLMARRLLLAGTHQGDHEMRVLGVCGPHLLSVEQPTTVIATSGGLDRS
jgi:hypothetical protein